MLQCLRNERKLAEIRRQMPEVLRGVNATSFLVDELRFRILVLKHWFDYSFVYKLLRFDLF